MESRFKASPIIHVPFSPTKYTEAEDRADFIATSSMLLITITLLECLLAGIGYVVGGLISTRHSSEHFKILMTIMSILIGSGLVVISTSMLKKHLPEATTSIHSNSFFGRANRWVQDKTLVMAPVTGVLAGIFFGASAQRLIVSSDSLEAFQSSAIKATAISLAGLAGYCVTILGTYMGLKVAGKSPLVSSLSEATETTPLQIRRHKGYSSI